MKWIDYRKKLGIGFDDSQKLKMLSNKLYNRLSELFDVINKDYSLSKTYSIVIKRYYTEIGEPLPFQAVLDEMARNIVYCDNIKEIISRYVAFLKSLNKSDQEDAWSIFKDILEVSLKELNLEYNTVNFDNEIYYFPEGAKEFDSALVSQPLEWLIDYPKAHKTFCIALKQYSDGEYIRDTADNLRKALEEFLQEFLKNKKNLETNKNEICKYLGEQNIDAGIGSLFQPLINAYKNINDKIAKHNDKVDAKLLEFLLYQTGVLIRMVLSVKEGEK